MGTVETVRIVSEDSKEGFMILNKSDLTNKHKLWKAPEKELPKEDQPEKVAPIKRGKK